MHKEDMPIVTLIQRIKSGEINPRDIDRELRKGCVEILYAEGYSIVQLAQLLACSEKTISRDLKEVQAKNALSPSVELAKQFIGNMTKSAEVHIQHCMQLARQKNASVSEKTNAEYAAWKIKKELAEKLQLLGYLPLKAQQISAQVEHFFTEEQGIKKCVELSKDLIELRELLSSKGTMTPEDEDQFKELEIQIEKISVSEKIKSIKQAEASNE